jgi:hypothetical protein
LILIGGAGAAAHWMALELARKMTPNLFLLHFFMVFLVHPDAIFPSLG